MGKVCYLVLPLTGSRDASIVLQVASEQCREQNMVNSILLFPKEQFFSHTSLTCLLFEAFLKTWPMC